MDYQGNAKKKTESQRPQRPEKKVDRVTTGQVIVQKKKFGKKVRDIFVEADFKSVATYVIYDVLIPAAKNMIVDSATMGVKRMMYGEAAMRIRNIGTGPRISYHSPVNRGMGGSPLSNAPPVSRESRTLRNVREDFIISSREEADVVLERMIDIIDSYDVVSVADLNDLVGYPISPIDNKWGWVYLGDVQIRQVREGYLIDLPPAEPIQ